MESLFILFTILFLLGVLNASSISRDNVFYESFDHDWKGQWIVSRDIEYKGIWKYEKSSGHGDYGLLVSQKAKKYGIAIELQEAIAFDHDGTGLLILQYDIRLQRKVQCSGAYLKFLLPQDIAWTPSDFNDATPYSIMFGPDRCGATNKIHFIFRHRNPKTGDVTEHHLKHPPMPVNDKFSHVYTAIISNRKLKIKVDGQDAKYVDLLSDRDFEPPVIPPLAIEDPDDIKPSDWDDREKIVDTGALKPEDWDDNAPYYIDDEDAPKPEGWFDDEPIEIDDPNPSKPKDWDDKEDGEWVPSKIANPKCETAPGCGEWLPPVKRNPNFKGKWKPPLVPNPNYAGEWKPREIPNPNYFTTDRVKLEPIGGVGIDIWTMDSGILFDNILITRNKSLADEVRHKSWETKFDAEKAKEEIADAAKSIYNLMKGPSSVKEWIFHIFYKIIDGLTYLMPFLEVHKYKMIMFVKKGEDHFALTMSILGTIPLFLFSILYNLSSTQKKKNMIKMEPDNVNTFEKSENDKMINNNKKDSSFLEDEQLIDNTIRRDEGERGSIVQKTKHQPITLDVEHIQTRSI